MIVFQALYCSKSYKNHFNSLPVVLQNHFDSFLVVLQTTASLLTKVLGAQLTSLGGTRPINVHSVTIRTCVVTPVRSTPTCPCQVSLTLHKCNSQKYVPDIQQVLSCKNCLLGITKTVYLKKDAKITAAIPRVHFCHIVSLKKHLPLLN